MNTRDILAFANGVYSAHVGLDACGNPYAAGSSARHWLRGWRLMRRAMERQGKERERVGSEASEIKQEAIP